MSIKNILGLFFLALHLSIYATNDTTESKHYQAHKKTNRKTISTGFEFDKPGYHSTDSDSPRSNNDSSSEDSDVAVLAELKDSKISSNVRVDNVDILRDMLDEYGFIDENGKAKEFCDNSPKSLTEPSIKLPTSREQAAEIKALALKYAAVQQKMREAEIRAMKQANVYGNNPSPQESFKKIAVSAAVVRNRRRSTRGVLSQAMPTHRTIILYRFSSTDGIKHRNNLGRFATQLQPTQYKEFFGTNKPSISYRHGDYYSLFQNKKELILGENRYEIAGMLNEDYSPFFSHVPYGGQPMKCNYAPEIAKGAEFILTQGLPWAYTGLVTAGTALAAWIGLRSHNEPPAPRVEAYHNPINRMTATRDPWREGCQLRENEPYISKVYSRKELKQMRSQGIKDPILTKDGSTTYVDFIQYNGERPPALKKEAITNNYLTHDGELYPPTECDFYFDGCYSDDQVKKLREDNVRDAILVATEDGALRVDIAKYNERGDLVTTPNKPRIPKTGLFANAKPNEALSIRPEHTYISQQYKPSPNYQDRPYTREEIAELRKQEVYDNILTLDEHGKRYQDTLRYDKNSYPKWEPNKESVGPESSQISKKKDSKKKKSEPKKATGTAAGGGAPMPPDPNDPNGKNKNKNNKPQESTHPYGRYEDASYHTKTGNSVKSAKPTNGQHALDNSLELSATSGRRISVSHGEFVVLTKTSDLEYHGHVRTWAQLEPEMKATLIKAGLTRPNGKIIK